MGTQMKRKVMFIIFCILFTLLFPYFITMLINGKNEADVYETDKSGRTVIISDGESNSKVDVEEFIPCVLSAQLPTTQEEEALKAQAVILRTYILKTMGDSLEINASELELPYLTYSKMQKTWKDDFADNYNKLIKAVLGTNLEVMRVNDQLIAPYYHEASAGATRNGNEVFGNEEYPYLQSVESLQDVEAKNYLSIKYYSDEEFIEKLKSYRNELELDASTVADSISVTQKCSAGYALEVNVGNVTMSGEDFAACLELNSSFFTVEKYEEKIRIITKGIGHGLGLSMYGANCLANEGKSYQEILSYYYKNIVLESE